ncbi:hypothetical protein EG68_07820 [Paragonimus skrjabini miyazakii]|uniref:Uncharacterized protein n=1 Tax=Paragonimus skrjabini miyazakii TaxID=59628 RepID=A0A8S9YXY3_9TREM|nr:hypothetical protein EG68_07820 [Paragonimus skrjabini miyazakii]
MNRVFLFAVLTLCLTISVSSGARLYEQNDEKRGAYLDLPWGKRSIPGEYVRFFDKSRDEEFHPHGDYYKRMAYHDLPWGRR